MSYEFRETGGYYFWASLSEAADVAGEHAISNVLCEIYRALGNIEHGCAAFEAGDSSASRPRIALQDHMPALEAAMKPLRAIYDADRRFIEDALLKAREQGDGKP